MKELKSMLYAFVYVGYSESMLVSTRTLNVQTNLKINLNSLKIRIFTVHVSLALILV